MVIGVLSLEFFLPACRSLKDKRRILLSFKERVRGRFNVALAEVDFQDVWQRAVVAVVTLNCDRVVVDQVLRRIQTEAETSLEGEVVKSEICYL
jgi:uncharacterized protein YlxP (DUF503 family)